MTSEVGNYVIANGPQVGNFMIADNEIIRTRRGFLTDAGLYANDAGVVVNRAPDLRPGSVWVDLVRAGVRLVPANRLVLVVGPAQLP